MRSFLLVLLSSISATVLSAAAIVNIDPVTSQTSSGDTVTLNINGTGLIDLYSFQFDLQFQPGVLHANSVTAGSFLSAGGMTLFLPGTMNNTTGSIQSTAGSLTGSTPGVSGDGTFAAVQFTGIAIGSSPITLSNVILLNSQLGDIPFSLQSGQVQVDGPDTGIPEPATVMTMILGLAWVVYRKFRLQPPNAN